MSPAIDVGPTTLVGPARDSSGLLGRTDQLRDALLSDGYLFVRGVVSRSAIEDLRRDVIAVLDDAGWIERGTIDNPPVPSARSCARDDGQMRAIYRELFVLRSLHELAHIAPVQQLLNELIDEPLLVFPRPVLRVVFPSDEGERVVTPAHQDHLGMQGTMESYTAWTPLFDYSLASGPIAVAARSHLQGLRPFRPLAGARVAPCEDAGLESSWVSTNFHVGDLLVFHSLTVHRGLANVSPFMRLSVDFRFQSASRPVCELSLRDDADLPWDEVYEGWNDSPVTAWRDLTLDVQPFDPTRLQLNAEPRPLARSEYDTTGLVRSGD